jgi:CRISPR-associated endonuclease/helicase Cas3
LEKHLRMSLPGIMGGWGIDIMKRSEYYSHSHPSGRFLLLASHLQTVAKRAYEYAKPLGFEDEARITGLLHDLGKYGHLFQRRLRGEEHGIDHWSIGAWAALMQYKNLGIATALSIQGHHIGLQKADKDSFHELNPESLSRSYPMNLRLSETDYKTLLKRLKSDGLTLPDLTAQSASDPSTKEYAAAMLDIRMLFSTLVDADFIETEAHFQSKDGLRKCYRPNGPPLQPDMALSVLLTHLQRVSEEHDASSNVLRMRTDLLEACRSAASQEQGLFTLTAPTGSGKTLSMLAFALEHAKTHSLQRVVMVIPYLSIIDQTANNYRDVFEKHFGGEEVQYVLENHSLAGAHDEKRKSDDETDLRRIRDQLAENWDAPIVVTTSVQFLESLFSNRPSACRKLHRLARSIILFDEVQTLPLNIIVPTLATLSHLVKRYRSTAVFATATQPAFSELDAHVRQFCASGWTPHEIVAPGIKLYSRTKRTTVRWPQAEEKTTWEELAEALTAYQQVLCIVNLKRHALELFDRLLTLSDGGIFHLSTNMCPAHRRAVLEKVRECLNRDKACRLVSTQCVEAGVDVDFPIVYRALGPMDAIAQAAGRCNRNGRSKTGQVIIFQPDDSNLYPPGAYSQAASVTSMLLQESNHPALDIDDPELFNMYYRTLYSFRDMENQAKELVEAIKRLDFVEVAKLYRVIDKAAVNVLVPYIDSNYEELKAEAEEKGLSRRWIARARPYTVGLYKPGKFEYYLKPVPVSFGRMQGDSEEWFVYLIKEHYDNARGLVPPSDELLIT